jgi:hypothetical protein
MVGSAIGAFALALTLAAHAQEQAAPKEHTMTGCLQKGTAPDTFVVQNTAEKGPKTIGIVESTAKLAPHVGHKIDITGTGVPNKDAESMSPAPPKADHYMKITAVKMVSATCP